MIRFYKLQGETPLQALNRLRILQPELATETLSYAGRLDPMAEGLLLVLVGKQENSERQKYLSADKEYEVEVVFGIQSDTYDALGLILYVQSEKEITSEQIKIFLRSMEGKQIQKYPPFSSKFERGKALFVRAREGSLDETNMPQKEVVIYSAKLLDFYQKNIEQIYEEAVSVIEQVQGDFRQKEIVESWHRCANDLKNQSLYCCRMQISCSSGTYMRSIAHKIGKKCGTGAIAFKIKRTKIS